MRKTKIVCTLGPATNTKEKIRDLAVAGMDIARLNFSHGTHAEHKKLFALIGEVSKELGKAIGILGDLEGHKIRIGQLKDPDGVFLKEGQILNLTSEDIKGDESQISVSFKDFAKYAKVGASAFIDDGKIELRIEEIKGKEVKTKVAIGGLLGERKGIHIPGSELGLPPLSGRDVDDINFAVDLGVDYIAQSFVRNAQDIVVVKELLAKRNAKHILVIAKIEDGQGINNIEEIIDTADGIMIARGDMGVCVPPSEIPLIQKMIIKKCNDKGKPVITATEMLDSMTRRNRPTRAEITDVANAIFDGTDIVMLSGETASGAYPVESVKFMDDIARTAETSLNYERLLELREILPHKTVADSIGHSARELAQLVNAKYIFAFTLTGQTARIISRYRPRADILAITPDAQVLKQLLPYWGVTPVKGEWVENVESYFGKFLEEVLRQNLVKKGDLVVVTAGIKEKDDRPSGIVKVMTA